jgi:hypothetical protein
MAEILRLGCPEPFAVAQACPEPAEGINSAEGLVPSFSRGLS